MYRFRLAISVALSISGLMILLGGVTGDDASLSTLVQAIVILVVISVLSIIICPLTWFEIKCELGLVETHDDREDPYAAPYCSADFPDDAA